jgi:hypothetical protein
MRQQATDAGRGATSITGMIEATIARWFGRGSPGKP